MGSPLLAGLTPTAHGHIWVSPVEPCSVRPFCNGFKSWSCAYVWLIGLGTSGHKRQLKGQVIIFKLALCPKYLQSGRLEWQDFTDIIEHRHINFIVLQWQSRSRICLSKRHTDSRHRWLWTSAIPDGLHRRGENFLGANDRQSVRPCAHEVCFTSPDGGRVGLPVQTGYSLPTRNIHSECIWIESKRFSKHNFWSNLMVRVSALAQRTVVLSHI